MTNLDHRSLDRLAALAADTRGDSARIAQVLAAVPALIEAARDRNECIDPDDVTAEVQAARRDERDAIRHRIEAWFDSWHVAENEDPEKFASLRAALMGRAT